MAKLIQIRNVPEAVHRRLKARAALMGMSLSEYLLREVTRLAERPTIEEWRQRLASRRAVKPSREPAAVIRGQRDRR
jgi:plasmid stability protein